MYELEGMFGPSTTEMWDWAHDEGVDYVSRTFHVANTKITRWHDQIEKVRQQAAYLGHSKLYLEDRFK